MRSESAPVAYKDLMKPDEDWRKMPNHVERRRVQNRIAQRAYRRNMKARTNEVEVLKQRICELQESAWEGMALGAFGDTSSTSNALSGSQDAQQQRSGSHEKDGAEQRNIVNTPRQLWRHSSEPGNLDALPSALRPRPRSPECFLTPPLLPSVSTKGSRPWSTARAEHRKAPKKGSEDHLDPSLFSSQPASVEDAHPPSACMDLGSLPLWHDFDTSLPPDLNRSSPSAPPSLTQSASSIHSLTKPGLTQVGASPFRSPPTLLHLAIASGNAGTLQLLLHNLDISTSKKDAAGYTPLQRAVMGGRTDLVAILLEYGADLASDDEISELNLDADMGDMELAR